MQPLGYLAARALVTCFQALERSQRAFAGQGSVLLAAGVAHCWAVVYSLIISLAMQAVRITGGRGDHIDQLPFWAFKAEQLAMLSGLVWWLASMALFMVRAIKLDDDAQGLPMKMQDTGIHWIISFVQSPTLHQVLNAAHILSCAGNFLSVVLLCSAIAWMGGGITLCEICLAVVAAAFALPHAALAVQRVALEWRQYQLRGQNFSGGRAPVVVESDVTLAVASEAASLGPQLTVVLACADMTVERPHFWVSASSVIAVVAFIGSMVACGLAPPRRRGAAVPPSVAEVAANLAVDVLGAATLVLSFMHLATWHWWLLLAIFAGMVGCVAFGPFRLLLVELVEPIMPLSNGGEKARPLAGPRRDLARQLARGAVVVCAAMALQNAYGRWAQQNFLAPTPAPFPTWNAWEEYNARNEPGRDVHDAHLPPGAAFMDGDEHEGMGDMYEDPDDYHDWPHSYDRFADWSASELLLLRWRPDLEGSQEGAAMMAAAQALGIDPDDLIVRDSLSQYRILIFEVNQRNTGDKFVNGSAVAAWQRVLATPPDSISSLVDDAFPHVLNVTLCEGLSKSDVDEVQLTPTDQERLSAEPALPDAAAMRAYAGACAAWRTRPIFDDDPFGDERGMPYDPYDGDDDDGGEPPEPPS